MFHYIGKRSRTAHGVRLLLKSSMIEEKGGVTYDKRELDSKISDFAKSLLSYCTARTSNHFDAQDLVQDIIVEIYKSADKIAAQALDLKEAVTRILKNHMPVHLKKSAADMAYFKLFEDAISAPVSILCAGKFILPYDGEGMLPTTYAVLNCTF